MLVRGDKYLLRGLDGDDVLVGGPGPHLMVGGPGNDIYHLDDAGDLVTEKAGEGNDIVYARVDYTLPSDVESIVLVAGAGPIDAAGNGAPNALVGNSDANVLDGGGGDDVMIGGPGDDIYVVDSTSDVVVEMPNQGNDIVYALVDYTIGANVESVVLVEGAGPINAAGNDAVNALVGNSDDNTLDGKGGDDTMIGGAGNDIYFVDSTSDLVVENSGEGNDIVYASLEFTIGANVESVVLTGTGNINAAGSADVNALVGNSGNNVLDGKGGDDTILAGAGDDRIIGGGQADAMFGEGGDDSFLVCNDAFAFIDGGDGLDRIVLTTPGQSFDLSANAEKIVNVEIISLASSSGAILSLSAADIAHVNPAGNFLYVVGGSDDQVSSGDAWDLVSTTHTNATVSGDTFVHYHNAATGADLYLADTFAFTNASDFSFDNYLSPTVFLDGMHGGVGLPDWTDHAATYTTGNTAGVAISDVDADIFDAAGLPITQLTALLTDPHSDVASEHLMLSASGQALAASNGITVSGQDTFSLTLSGAASDQVYECLLREILYVNTDVGELLDTSARHVAVVASDGIDASNVATATISLVSGYPDVPADTGAGPLDWVGPPLGDALPTPLC